jgi:hypothetical protein
MNYASILVRLDTSSRSPARLRFALRLTHSMFQSMNIPVLMSH